MLRNQTNWKPALAIAGVFIGCCSNVVFLELLVKSDPGSGNLITLSQFLFIALEGFIFTSNFGTKKPRIGLKQYSILVLMFFVTSVCNNYAFDFNIPMPLHMIFRAGSLIANMIMGIIILKKRYIASKYISVLMISLGIVICTIISGSNVQSTATTPIEDNLEESQFSVFFWWTIGILLLTAALFISAYMGIYQEMLYKRFGKHPYEALYYTHLLPIPAFLLMYKNIWSHTLIMAASEPIEVPILSNIGINVKVPITAIYLLCNVVSQYVCISSVYVLTTECASLTVTLIVTLRKFVSLLFSILYFKNSFTLLHYVGTGLVFIGTIIFTELIPQVVSQFKPVKEKKKLN
ncbi:UDP-xylose and UDP-N-acetylglucosamine transporter [Teleopsis dalmanni]|uniref:UDP-xylose and UDP-N-acetylglucosamine transporter n=1 Tax=Teleopsis dalmanni TaxID=139649 RepID=UPI0018CDC6ED|nr:UDP-xylose and UDP-N-acetylglucosamine transporter [Teleopsis dalmanni]